MRQADARWMLRVGRRTKRLTKDDDRNVDGAEDAELVCLLEEAVLALSCVRRWAQSVIERVLMDAKRIDIFIATDL